MAAMDTLNSDAIVLVLVFIDFLFAPTAPGTFRFQARVDQCNFDTGSAGAGLAITATVKHIITQYLR
jgi:hypothetical protein